MPNDFHIRALMAALEKTAYFRWMRREGIPVHLFPQAAF